MIKLSPVGYGNHNNIHFNFVIKTTKTLHVSIKLTGFNDTGIAYISSTNFNTLFNFIDKEYLSKVINDMLAKFEFKLYVTEACWNNKNLTSEILLNKYVNR